MRRTISRAGSAKVPVISRLDMTVLSEESRTPKRVIIKPRVVK